MNMIRSTFSLVLGACLLLGAAILPAAAANSGDWNYGYGMGNINDDPVISGAGVPLAVIPSVQSNSLYYVTSAFGSGAARIKSVFFRNDSIGGTLAWYVATNSWTCASNQPAGTNILWLSSTNSGLATNDLLILQSKGAGTLDSYQLLVLSGNATDSAGLVYTNSSGYNAVKVFTTPTNTITAGDVIYKLARVQTFTPLAMGLITNQINAVTSDHFAQWLKFPGKEVLVPFSAKIGQPGALIMTYSNAAGLYVDGEYYVRPRR